METAPICDWNVLESDDIRFGKMKTSSKNLEDFFSRRGLVFFRFAAGAKFFFFFGNFFPEILGGKPGGKGKGTSLRFEDETSIYTQLKTQKQKIFETAEFCQSTNKTQFVSSLILLKISALLDFPFEGERSF